MLAGRKNHSTEHPVATENLRLHRRRRRFETVSDSLAHLANRADPCLPSVWIVDFAEHYSTWRRKPTLVVKFIRLIRSHPDEIIRVLGTLFNL